jgi:diguanylate cyclase
MGVLYYSAFSSYKLLHKTTYQASHDLLTDLYNRHSSVSLLQETINSLKNENVRSYILLIDLDHFKAVNDTLGHDIGDLLLQDVSSRMKNILSENHYIARLGGDEFIIISHKHYQQQSVLPAAKKISEELLHDLKQTYHIQGHHLFISASI